MRSRLRLWLDFQTAQILSIKNFKIVEEKLIILELNYAKAMIDSGALEILKRAEQLAFKDERPERFPSSLS